MFAVSLPTRASFDSRSPSAYQRQSAAGGHTYRLRHTKGRVSRVLAGSLSRSKGSQKIRGLSLSKIRASSFLNSGGKRPQVHVCFQREKAKAFLSESLSACALLENTSSEEKGHTIGSNMRRIHHHMEKKTHTHTHTTWEERERECQNRPRRFGCCTSFCGFATQNCGFQERRICVFSSSRTVGSQVEVTEAAHERRVTWSARRKKKVRLFLFFVHHKFICETRDIQKTAHTLLLEFELKSPHLHAFFQTTVSLFLPTRSAKGHCVSLDHQRWLSLSLSLSSLEPSRARGRVIQTIDVCFL